MDGLVVPGGFGTRGLEGKIKAAQYCLTNKKPYLGLCLGLQMAVIAAARNAGIKDATTVELDPEGKNQVINIMADQRGKENTGGSMRLGAYPAKLVPGTIAAGAYGALKVSERHRHRYEVNNTYRPALEEAGLVFSGTSPDGTLCEIAELPRKAHPFFLGTQFHPELKARPLEPHPLFTAFLKAALKG